MVRIKISGITSLEDARFCAGAGADFLGFVQEPGSERFVPPAMARQIIDWVHGATAVGEFRDMDSDSINESCDRAGFAMAQLDGHESVEVVEAVGVPVIKTVNVQHDASTEHLRALLERYVDAVEYFLIDTRRTTLWGGAGESLNWRVIRDLAADFPLFLAGEVDGSNLQETVDTMRPFGIDVETSVESAPGVKDYDRISALFDAVRDLD